MNITSVLLWLSGDAETIFISIFSLPYSDLLFRTKLKYEDSVVFLIHVSKIHIFRFTTSIFQSVF